MIVTRALQGFTGGVMIPMAFTMVLTRLPPAQRPIGLAAIRADRHLRAGDRADDRRLSDRPVRLAVDLLRQPGPRRRDARHAVPERSSARRCVSACCKEGDWWGIATMAMGLACLQTVLDEGNKDGWFDSPTIVRLAIVRGGHCSPRFVVIELRGETPAVRLRLLATRNFGLGTLANVTGRLRLFGSVYVLPAYLDEVQGYDAAADRPRCSPGRHCRSSLIIPFVPALLQAHSMRGPSSASASSIVRGSSCFMNTHLSFDNAGPQFMLTNLVRALGQAIAPAHAAVQHRDGADAAGGHRPPHRVCSTCCAAWAAPSGRQRSGDRDHQARAVPFEHHRPVGDPVQSDRPVLPDSDAAVLPDPWRAGRQPVLPSGRDPCSASSVAQQSLILAFSDAFYVMGLVLVSAAVAIVPDAVRSKGDGGTAR